MKVLAIDPGYGRCGMAVVERTDSGDVLRYSTCIETPQTDDFSERLHAVAEACDALLETHVPDHLAMERLYFNTNKKTAMRVAEVRGALLALAAARGVPVHEYTPGQVKSATTGSGTADKKAVAMMLHSIMKIDRVIARDDEYDAIAVGVTHLAYAGRAAAIRIAR